MGDIPLVQKRFSGYGDLFSKPPHRGGPAHHLTTLLVTAPIAATNGIEDRHKEGSVLKQPCSGGLLSYLQYYGALRLPVVIIGLYNRPLRALSLSKGRSTTSGQMVVDLKRDPHNPKTIFGKE